MRDSGRERRLVATLRERQAEAAKLDAAIAACLRVRQAT